MKSADFLLKLYGISVSKKMSTQLAACGGRNFWRNEGDGASRFTAFLADMALVTCTVWRATRLV